MGVRRGMGMGEFGGGYLGECDVVTGRNTIDSGETDLLLT